MSDPQGRSAVPVPVGLQTLLRLAAVDPAFREELVARRAAVAGAASVALTPSERAILAALPDEQLRQMAEQMPPPPSARRAFLRQTAATAVVLLGGAAMAATVEACCADEAPIHRPDIREMDTAGGAAPDWPDEPAGEDDDSAEAQERPDIREMDIGGGAAPDTPPDRPETTTMPTRGGAAPDMPGGH